MKGKHTKNYLILFFALSAFSISAQHTKSDKPVWKQDTVFGDNIFRKHSNWISAGGGLAANNQIKNSQFVFGLDYNLHIHTQYFQLGLFLSGDRFGSYNNYQFHGCYGKRIETTSINFSYFGGASYSVFFEQAGSNYSQTPKNSVGAYACAQLIKKIKYDVGIGLSVFADINFSQSVMGAKVDVYLSGAYKGKKEY
ncbi:MAG: hypothetical protein IT235_07825 [Bacteroidia bacterium]|nr:hypothetical protein [Bacteroidia bacterium]